jgi:cytochrome c553
MRQARSVWSIWSIWLVLLLDPEKPNSQINETDQTDEIDRTDQMNKTGWLNFFSILLVGWLAIQFIHMSDMNAWAGSPPSPKSTKVAGDAERGRAVFNGKGVCYYCHGIDGSKDQRPQLAADTAALIAQLNPQPVDLRNPKVLHLKTDKQRARAIREGHPGTGMFPDMRMMDQELADTLAYLAVLRQQDSKRTSKP